MYVSVIRGVPTRWAGHARVIRHYTSHDLFSWTYRSTVSLSSERVIDACVLRLPTGGYRMWYKDEADPRPHVRGGQRRPRRGGPSGGRPSSARNTKGRTSSSSTAVLDARRRMAGTAASFTH